MLRPLPLLLTLILLPAAAAQTLPSSTPNMPLPGPVIPLTAEARNLLTLLHDRKDTLKDFTAKLDYSTKDPLGDISGKRGDPDKNNLSYITDPIKGPTFSVDFTMNTENGKPKQPYHTQFIFDGRDFTIKDFGSNNDVKQFVRTTLVPPGTKPGDAVSLNGPLPLPIGLDVNDVQNTFEVTVISNNDKEATLKLVPRFKQKFDYTQLTVTVDKHDQLPIKLVESTTSGDEVTLTLSEIKVNTGTAKILDPATPTKDGWIPRKGG